MSIPVHNLPGVASRRHRRGRHVGQRRLRGRRLRARDCAPGPSAHLRGVAMQGSANATVGIVATAVARWAPALRARFHAYAEAGPASTGERADGVAPRDGRHRRHRAAAVSLFRCAVAIAFAILAAAFWHLQIERALAVPGTRGEQPPAPAAPPRAARRRVRPRRAGDGRGPGRAEPVAGAGAGRGRRSDAPPSRPADRCRTGGSAGGVRPPAGRASAPAGRGDPRRLPRPGGGGGGAAGGVARRGGRADLHPELSGRHDGGPLLRLRGRGLRRAARRRRPGPGCGADTSSARAAWSCRTTGC